MTKDEKFHKLITTISSSQYGSFINQKLDMWYDRNIDLYTTGDSLTYQALLYAKELCKEYNINV